MRLRQLHIHYQQGLAEGMDRLSGTWALPALRVRPEWRPPVDVYETRTDWVVTVELAGLQDDDFELLLYPGHLVVQGVRPWQGLGEDANPHAAEIRRGPFQVAVTLPRGSGAVEVDRIQAAYDRGLLNVRLPKRSGSP